MNNDEHVIALVNEFSLADLYTMAIEADKQYIRANYDLNNNFGVKADIPGEEERAMEEVNKLRQYSKLLQSAYNIKLATQMERAKEIIDKVPTL